MLIIGTDTLVDFAFAMFCGMVVGVYSTLAISAPIYTKWKAKDPAYTRLENKYPYEVVQSPFTKQMMLEARKETAEKLKVEKQERKEAKAAEREAAAKVKQEEKDALLKAKETEKHADERIRHTAGEKLDKLKQAERETESEIDRQIAPDIFAGSDSDIDEDRQSAALDEREPEAAQDKQRHDDAARAGISGNADDGDDAESDGAEAVVREADDSSGAESGDDGDSQEASATSGKYSAAKPVDSGDDTITTTTSFSYEYVTGEDYEDDSRS